VRRARQAVGGRRRPPPRTLPAVARAAAATAAQATRAERAAAALAAEMEGLARARRDVMRRRRQERLDDALAAAADETAVDETEAGGVGTADAAGGRNGAAGARKRRRGEGDGEDRDRRRGGCRRCGPVAACLTGQATTTECERRSCDEASDDGRDAATSGGDAGDAGGGDDDGDDDGGASSGQEPLEFDPSTAPIGEWTTEGLMEFFLHPSVKTRDPAQWMPEIVAILDEKPRLYKTSLHCKLRSNDGQTNNQIVMDATKLCVLQ
jgi:hypothetical protein